MAEEKKHIIDIVAYSPKDDVYLVIIAHEGAWDGSESQLAVLQDKLNAYLCFIEDGQMARMYPESVGKKVTIQINSEYDLDPKTKNILDKVKTHLLRHNVGLTFHKYKSTNMPYIVKKPQST